MSDDEEAGIHINELKKYFPTLYDEFANGKTPVSALIDEVELDEKKTRISKDPFKNYSPTYVDFLQRAKTIQECLDVIDFLVSVNELDENLAEELKQKAVTYGPEIFGSRDDNYYTSHYFPS